MLQKSHWLSVVFGETWVAALAVVAVMHLSQLDQTHASDGYLQIEVANHYGGTESQQHGNLCHRLFRLI